MFLFFSGRGGGVWRLAVRVAHGEPNSNLTEETGYCGATVNFMGTCLPPFVWLDGRTPLHIHTSVYKHSLAYFISNRRREAALARAAVGHTGKTLLIEIGTLAMLVALALLASTGLCVDALAWSVSNPWVLHIHFIQASCFSVALVVYIPTVSSSIFISLFFKKKRKEKTKHRFVH